MRKLNNRGFGLYSIDYTRNFSGTLDRDRLYDHFLGLGFSEFGDGGDVSSATPQLMGKNMLEITAGRIIVKYKYDNIRVKYYNKIVCNFEAGDVRSKNTTHLADYAWCSNKHLGETFCHTDVLERGLTRLEISIGGFDYGTNYSELLDVEFRHVKDAKIFHIQPGSEHWKRLAETIDRSFVIANKTTGEISHVWYGSTVAIRYGRVNITVSKKHLQNPREWNNAILWMVNDFGFDGLPVFLLEIEVIDYDGGKKLEVGELKCMVRSGPTFLAPSYKPTKVYKKEVPDASTYLPDTKNISWVFRRVKLPNAIGRNAIHTMPQEIPHGRTVSLLSTRKREQLTRELQEKYRLEEWREECIKILEKDREKERGKEDLLRERESVEKTPEMLKKAEERRSKLLSIFQRQSKNNYRKAVEFGYTRIEYTKTVYE